MRLRPDVIGGILAWHPRDGRFTNAMSFSSEAEARAKEHETSNAPEFEQYMSEHWAISDGHPVPQRDDPLDSRAYAVPNLSLAAGTSGSTIPGATTMTMPMRGRDGSPRHRGSACPGTGG